MGSSIATIAAMATIQQKELRNQVGEILRRAEAGERFTITVSGRPVAELGPVRARQWVSSALLSDLWATSPDLTLDDDLGVLGGGLSDPWAE
jgi:prevent-host-death family protein